MMRRGRSVALALGLLAALAAWPAARDGAPRLAAQESESLEFHRVRVPADELAGFARGYLPIRDAEFQRLLSDAARRGRRGGAPGAGCSQAEYAARFENDAFVDGRARLVVRGADDGPTTWIWDDVNLALDAPRWNAPQPGPALAGLVASGRQGVLVERPGTLDFDWTLRGERGQRDGIQFVLRTPPAAVQELRLDLPASLVPQANDAFIRKLASDEATAGDEFAGRRSTAPTADRIAWSIAWRGDRPLDLRLVPAGRRATPHGARVRQESFYVVDARGLELQADLRIDATGEPLQAFTLLVDRRLQIGAVRSGDKQLAWSRRGSAVKDHDEVLVQTPDLSGEERLVQISALAPLETGAAWTLPALRPADLAWMEGEAQVAVLEPLAASRIDVRGGRVTGATSLPAERRRTWRARMQEPDAQLIVAVEPIPTRLRIRSGTTVAVDAGNMTSRCVAAVTPLHGSLFFVEAELPRAWLVDGVEALEGPAVDEYQTTLLTSPSRQLLRVRLREPLAVGRTSKLVVRARRSPPAPNTSLGVDQLRLLRFRDGAGATSDARQLVAVGGTAQARPRFFGDHAVEWLDPDSLSESDQTFVEALDGARIFAADRAADELEVRFERERPRYRGELEVSAVVRGERLVESYRLRLVPDASALDRVPVYLTRSRSGALHWRLEGAEEGAAPNYRRLAPAGETNDPGETWELSFARPRTAPFTLVAERSSRVDGGVVASLASLPEATEQSGRVRLAASVGAGRWIDRGLRPIADVAEEDAERAARELGVLPGTVGFFEYEPVAAGAAGLAFEPGKPAAPRVWAELARLRTWIGPDGAVRHRCEYEVENVGADEVTFRLGDELRVERVAVAGVDRTPPADEAEEGVRRVRCPLPVATRRALVTLELVGDQAAGERSRRVATPNVTAEFPVLERTWRIALSDEWRVWRVEGAESADQASGDYDPRRLWPAASWNRRLFGLLLRDAAEPAARIVAADDDDAGRGDGDSAARPGGTAFELKLAGRESAAVSLCRPGTWNACAWAAALIAAAVVGRAVARRAWFGAVAVFVAGFVALTVSGPESVVAGGVFLGTLFAPLAALGMDVVVRGDRPSGTRGGNDANPAEGTTRTAAVAGAALVALAAACGDAFDASGPGRERPFGESVAAAQEGEPPTKPAAEPAPRAGYRVLMAIGEDGKRTDEFVHVPREFYALLRRRAAASGAADEAYFLTGAEYSATVRSDEPAGVDVTVDYEVDVRSADASVIWPFARNVATLFETRATRGGETVELDWRPEEAGWRTTFAEPGAYRVRVRLRVAADAEGTSAELSIPPVARSVLRWRGAEGAREAPRVRDAAGPTETDEDGGRRVRLGATSRLRIQWNPAYDAPGATAEQAFWLHVRPGSVQCDFSMRLPPQAVPANRLVRLRHDPQLRLLPPAGGATVVRAIPEPGTSGGLLVEVAPTDQPVDLRLSFLLSRSTGIGRIVVPRIEWPGGRIERRWLAVTVAPTLELSRQEGASLDPLPVPAFLQAWGMADALPLVAYRVASDDEPALLAIRQREATWSDVETSTYSLRRDRGELRWEADVVVENGPIFQHEAVFQHEPGAAAPRVLEASVFEAGEETARPLRWTASGDGRLRFLSDQPLEGTHRLVVRVDYPLPFDKETKLPMLTLVGRSRAARTLRLTRHDAVWLERATCDDWTPDESSGGGAARSDEGRDAGRWIWTPGPERDDPAPPSVLVRSNRARLRGRMLTALQPAGETWTAIVRGAVQPDRGRLERVRLEAPAEWAGPWVDDERAAWNTRTAPGQSRAQLTRDVPADAPSPFTFALRGTLKFARAEHPRAPDVQLLDAVAQDRYLALPTVERGRRITWETNGLRAVVQPDAWLAETLRAGLGGDPPHPYQFYQIVAPRFQAAVADVNEESPEARVRHAGHQFHLGDSGDGWARSTFTLDAGGRHDCVLDLPPGDRLVYARVDGADALVESLADGGWRVPLVDAYEPQNVELVYLVAAEAGPAGALTDRVARVRNWPTERSSLHRSAAQRRSRDDSGRWPAAATLGLVAGAALALGRARRWRDWLAVSPALPAVLLALVWWLWFDPRWLGVALGLAALAAANLPGTIRLGTRRPL